jgi:hypothetical protein
MCADRLLLLIEISGKMGVKGEWGRYDFISWKIQVTNGCKYSWLQGNLFLLTWTVCPWLITQILADMSEEEDYKEEEN